MKREEFLKKLFTIYANSFNKGNGAVMADAYNRVLNPDYDYDKLYDFVLLNCTTAPSPSLLAKNATFLPEIRNKEVKITNILANKNGKEFEYSYIGGASEFAQNKYSLEKQGFTNVRYKYPQDYENKNEYTKQVRNWVD